MRGASEVRGYTDRGGRAEIAGDTIGLIHRAILAGRVYDSIAGKGLAGALVWVRGHTDSMPTDHAGRFEMALDLAGDQVVSVRHPRLGLLGESTERSALLSLGDTTLVQFAVPSLATLVRSTCGNRNRPGRIGVVGMASRADGSIAVDQEIVATKRTSRGNEPIAETAPARTTRTGLYGLCNLPARDTVQVSLMVGKTTQVELPVALGDASRWVELREWGSADSASVGFVGMLARVESTRESSSGLPAVISGRVYDATTGKGIPGVVVRVHSESDSVLTDSLGRFSLQTRGTGWQIVTVAQQGLGQLRGVVTRNTLLAAGDTVAADFPVTPVETVMRRLCGDRSADAGVLGIASGSTGLPESDLVLRMSWMANGRREQQTRSGPGGLFAFCDLPTDLTGGETLTLEVSGTGGVAGQSLTQLLKGEHRWVEIGLPKR